MLSVITYIVLTIGGTCENIPVLTNLAKNSSVGRDELTMAKLEKTGVCLAEERLLFIVKHFK